MEVAPNLKHLYAHLVENGFVKDITSYNPDYLKVYSSDVLKKIKANDNSWETLIPPAVVEAIKAKKLFGWK
jgi:hypothetical protein